MKASKAKKFSKELAGPPKAPATSYEADDEIPEEETELTEDELLVEGTGWLSEADKAEAAEAAAKKKGKKK